MSSQLKRMTFSIYMDPGALESDRYAVGILQNWYQRARKIQDGTEEFDFSKSRFHKDIYLSGMFMYVLAPNLCKAIANALGPEQVSLTTLRHAFASCGFQLGDELSTGAQFEPQGMVDQIVARLTSQPWPDQAALAATIADQLAAVERGPDQAALAAAIAEQLAAVDRGQDQDALAAAIADRLAAVERGPDQAALAATIADRLAAVDRGPDQDALAAAIADQLAAVERGPDQAALAAAIADRLAAVERGPDQEALAAAIADRLAAVDRGPDQAALAVAIAEQLAAVDRGPDQAALAAAIADQLAAVDRGPDQTALAAAIADRLAAVDRGQDQEALVDKLVSRLAAQPLGEGQAGALDPQQLADTIAAMLPGGMPDLAPLQSSILQLSRQLEEQSKLIRDQHRLIQRLASSPGSHGAVDGTVAAPLVEDLSTQVANMKKVKAKGIF